MSEKNLKKRLSILTTVVILLSLCLVAGGTFVSKYLGDLEKETMYQSLENDARKYKNDLEKQIDADFQTLRTLAAFLNSGQRIQVDTLIKGLSKSSEYTQFVRMGFFEVNKNGLRVDYQGGKEEFVELEAISKGAQELVKKAWNGEESFSKFYIDNQFQKNVIAYAVPVYEDDVVIGALVATNEDTVYKNILDNAKSTSGKGHTYLISSEGKFLIEDQQKGDKEDIDNIFITNYVQQVKKVEEALANKEHISSTLKYGGYEYEVFFSPVGVHDWYIMNVDSVENVNPSMHTTMTVIQQMFLFILLLVFVLIVISYRLLRSSNQKIIDQAYYDPLTKIYNSTRFQQAVSERLNSNKRYALVSLNILKFKFINQVYGKIQGDLLLCHIANVLKSNMGKYELYCRENADIFLVLMEYDSYKQLHERLETIMQEIVDYSLHKHRKHEIIVHCGVSYRKHDDTCDKLLNRAIFAMKQAKGNHQNLIIDYDEDVHQASQLQNYIESHMQQALDDEEFKLYLHPKFDLHTDKLQGAEALVRWIRKDGSMIFPDQFIPLFEQNGFCVELDFYMVKKACAQLREWMNQGYEPIMISINQSKLMFYQKDYVKKLLAIVNAYDIDPYYITLEILEGLSLEEPTKLNDIILQLKEVGFRISMDDFGSGYSSLHILSSLQIDELKLDRVFLKEVHGENGYQQEIIMKNIIQLAKSMGMMTVAEGVETMDDEILIKEIGCDVGQGYYYNRPIPVDVFYQEYFQNQ